MKTLSIISLWLASCILSLGAGAINGVTYSAWNGVEISSWNGSAVSAAGGGGGGGGPTYTLTLEGSKAGASGSVTTDAADTTGATLIIVWQIYYNGTPAMADSKSNTWTGLTAYAGSGATYAVKIWYCITPTAGSGHTFTASGSIYNSVVYAAFSKTSPLFDTGKDNGVSGSASFTTIQPGSLTPSVDNCLVVTGVTWGNGGDGSIDSSFIALDQVANTDVATFRGMAAYKIQTTAGAENPTWTVSASGAGAVGMAVFK